MAIEVLVLLLALAGVLPAESKFMVYNTSAGIDPNKLNVHLVPHTHDDVGWLKTVDQYYVGSNNSIQAFFQRWWRDQSETVQSIVKQLVHSGQLELINGGMCMHDEAAPHYIDMIDQTTLGHRFIKEEFGVTPRIGWQIDPFGHSAVQAYLLSAEVGFDSLFFGRIDYQDRAKRKNEKSLEVIWQASKSLGSSAQIFAGAFPENYEPPKGFYFEVNDNSPIVQDDINLFDYNVQERVNDFVAAAVAQANITRTNHIMWTMGTDFKYQYAYTWFRQMDKLIHYVNQDGRVNALYSTPSIYTDAKYATNRAWPLKTGDYFPYADRANAYWTGYFTSRPALKRYVRIMSGYYLAARQLEFFKGKTTSGPNTDSLADALAIAQHHDAVTGTEKQHVANDYAKRLAIGYTEVLVVYNPLGWKREDIVQIPVMTDDISVHDSEGKDVESQLIPITEAYHKLRSYHVKAYLGRNAGGTPKYWLVFPVSVPALGFSTYSISRAQGTVISAGARPTKSSVYTVQRGENSVVNIGQGNLKAILGITIYTYLPTLVQESVEQSYSFYAGSNGTEKEPQTPLTVVHGSIVDELHEQINSWIYQVTRLNKLKEHIEVEFIVGPIPIDDGIGKEVATQISTTVKSKKTFYTDSSGRDFIERIRDYRTDWNLEVNQPAAGNYYPINLGIFMKDEEKEFSILVDRSVGGSSLSDGQIELMLHRRLLLDDSRGVAEALNETVCVENKCTGLIIQGKYYFRFDQLGEGARWRRSYGQEIYSPLLLAFAEEDKNHWRNSRTTSFSGIDSSYTLPENVVILTLQVGDHKELSVMTSVELKKLFPGKKIGKATEMSLSANQERAEMESKRLVWKVEGSAEEKETKVSRGGPVDPVKLEVELAPMEIRTFIIELVQLNNLFDA
ncbi:hypothetical protein CDL15_Pgr005576 [Punica granatum]|uniref:Alpha-mannosidase n=1 Tax=Punica granatum TaxID=22663 RepID=A0A218WFX8_PUNGR|nr:hypothetical protein CDL15_Pgr005576 [Punica granatum]